MNNKYVYLIDKLLVIFSRNMVTSVNTICKKTIALVAFMTVKKVRKARKVRIETGRQEC